MRLRGAGVIVNIASELAFKAAEGCTIYCCIRGSQLHDRFRDHGGWRRTGLLMVEAVVGFMHNINLELEKK